LTYDDWCEGIRIGRNYVSDGFSHLIDFKVNDVAVGENGSELKLSAAGKVRLTAKVAARLNETPDKKRFVWQIEKARIDDTRSVPLELIVNGRAVERREFVADGKLREVSFEVPLERSSWVALRIFPSSHSNPIFVLVDGKPIRDRKSIEWCLKGVDRCWSQKKRFYQESEMDDAVAAYDHAREVYRQRLGEAE
jgi:hypothetical protein